MWRAVLLASAMPASGFLQMDSPPLRGKAAIASSNAVDKAHQVVASSESKAVPSVSHDAKTEPSESDQLAKLQHGLETIQNLRAHFAHPVDKFAEGALSEELSKKDSGVWSTLTDMMDTTAKAMKQMKGKDKKQQHELMADLEKTMDSKAVNIMDITNKATKTQQGQDEEYLLGLLNQHPQWSMKQQLNATSTFMTYSPVIADLYHHYDAAKPLAPQLAELMDKVHQKQ